MDNNVIVIVLLLVSIILAAIEGVRSTSLLAFAVAFLSGALLVQRL